MEKVVRSVSAGKTEAASQVSVGECISAAYELQALTRAANDSATDLQDRDDGDERIGELLTLTRLAYEAALGMVERLNELEAKIVEAQKAREKRAAEAHS